MSGLAPELRTSKSIIEELKLLEEERDWLQYQVGGWSVWPLFRFSIFIKLSGLVLSPAPGLTRREQLLFCARDVLAIARPRRFRLLVKAYSTARGEWTEGGYKDVHFDDLLLSIGSYLKIEHVNSVQFLARSRQALVPSHMYNQLFLAMASLAIRARLFIPDAYEVAMALDKEFSECFGKGFISFHEILSEIQYTYWLKKFYQLALQWWRPQVVAVLNPSEFALVTAARELGIPTVEFQHGVLDGDQHPLYAWSAYAKPHKKHMPIPDVLFTYGDYWTEGLRQTGFWTDEVCSVGSLHVDAYRHIPFVRRLDGPLHVLYTSNGVDQRLVTRFLMEALSDWPDLMKPKLTIKLHPRYDPDPGPYLEETAGYSNVEVLLGSQGPSTFELMRQANVHCSISSMCHYDSIALGTPTVVLPFTLHENFLGLVERGHARFAPTPEVLRREIRQASAERVPDNIGTYYFKPNALENMLQALETLIQRSPQV